MAPPLFVVVSGPPASGKSTLAPVLARDLGLPLVAKDTIKDAVMSELAVPDVEVSQQLGRAAVAAMLAVGAESPVGAVIEIEVRDRHCTHPGCTIPAERCDVDHIIEWSTGGPTTQANGRLLCAHHNHQRPGRTTPPHHGP